MRCRRDGFTPYHGSTAVASRTTLRDEHVLPARLHRRGFRGAGFTLTEILVVLFLVLIVGGGLLTLLLSGQATHLSSEAYVQVQQEARRAFDSAIQELRGAGNVSLSADAKQLHFQLARGYNTEAACPNSICWGSETATGQWVHVVITGAGDNVQLVRCVTAALVDPVTDFTGCRVLGNRVKGGTSSFAWDAVNRVIALTWEFEYQNPALPGGRQTTTPLMARVRLRNP